MARLTAWEGRDADGPRAVMLDRDSRFEDAEEEVHQYYDYIFIDCSPGTGREHMDISQIVRELMGGENK